MSASECTTCLLRRVCRILDQIRVTRGYNHQFKYRAKRVSGRHRRLTAIIARTPRCIGCQSNQGNASYNNNNVSTAGSNNTQSFHNDDGHGIAYYSNQLAQLQNEHDYACTSVQDDVESLEISKMDESCLKRL